MWAASELFLKLKADAGSITLAFSQKTKGVIKDKGYQPETV